MKLILLRHGRTIANERHQYLGSTDQPVTADSLELLMWKRREGCYPDPSGYKVYTSGMRRTEDTLRAVYGNLAHEILPGMREIDFGSFECRTYEELKDTEAYQAWLSDFENTAPPSGESYREMKERVLKALRLLTEKDEDAILVTHGGPIAAIMMALFPEEGRNFYEWNPHHGEGFLVRLTDGKARSYAPLGAEKSSKSC